MHRELAALSAALPLIEEEHARRAAYKVLRYFPDCAPGCKPFSLKSEDHVPPAPGKPPVCRVLYTQAMAFFRAGEHHRERLFLAGNRTGKTDSAAYEIRCHMTGLYPNWWRGRRFEGPTTWWAAGDTMQTTRDIPQNALMGAHEGVPLGLWTGMLDAHLITNVTRKSGGVSNCLDTVYVQHASRVHGAPSVSALTFKSYDQGRRVFQGVELSGGIWLDEEPPDGSEKAEAEAQGSSDIYTECLLRTMTTDGIILATFTPLRGLTPFLAGYIETAFMPDAAGGEDDVTAKANFYPEQLGASAAEADEAPQ